MAHVVFALGARPGLSQDEALELAELLMRRRSTAADSASRKIRSQANRDPDQREKSEDIELSREELEEREAVLAEERFRRSYRDLSASETRSCRLLEKARHLGGIGEISLAS